MSSEISANTKNKKKINCNKVKVKGRINESKKNGSGDPKRKTIKNYVKGWMLYRETN